MTDRNAALEDVAALMLERQKYESWLASLDARRASTPDHVFTRVHGDYEARLKEVTDRLIKHRTALAQHLEILTARLATVEKDAQRLRDKRAEAELRMQVGELSVPDWNALARQCDDGTARLTEEQAQIRTQLGQAKEILAMVTGQAAGGTPAASPRQPRTSRPVSTDEIPPVEGLQTTNGAPPARATPHSSMNELEFLNTVVGEPTEMPAQQVAPGTARPTPNAPQKRAAPTPSAPRSVEPVKPPEPPPAPSPDAVKVDPDGAEDLAESLLSRVKSGGGSTLREDTDAESLLNGTKQPGGLRPLPTGAKPTGNNPAVPRPGAGDRHKTLKCGECGAMNFPTEWYCERCGAELSAV